MSNNKFLAIALFLALFLVPHKALAACGALPNIFTNNVSSVDANTTNTNNVHLQNCATQVDNTQIGSSGIFGSQIIPNSTGTATFGGAFGYTFNPNSGAQVPLTISNAVTPSADYLDVQTSASVKLFYVDSSGVSHSSQPFKGDAPYGNTAAAAFPYQYFCSGGNGAIGASSGVTISTVTGSALDVACNGTHLLTTDTSGNVGTAGTLNVNVSALGTTGDGSQISASGAVIGGNIKSTNGVFTAPAGVSIQLCPNNSCTAVVSTGGAYQGTTNACGSGSGLPCSTTTTLTYASNQTATNTVTVPSGSKCVATPTNIYGFASTPATPQASLASTTLTVQMNTDAAVTGTATINVICE